MTDYVMTNGKASNYPKRHFGGLIVGSTATFFLEENLNSPSANDLAAGTSLTLVTTTPTVINDKFFGLHICNRASDTSIEVPCASVRSHGMANGKSRWQFIQPTSSTWDWVDLDEWVDTHHTANRELVFTLFGTPQWASARPDERNAFSDQDPEQIVYNRGIAAEPADMTTWDTFCTAVATRYKGRIKYYEVWNEPNYSNDGTGATGTDSFFSGTYAKLAEMVRRANQAIKVADPDAKIICPPTTVWATTVGGTAEQYFIGMLASSTGDGSTTMKNWIDIVGVHLYINGNDITKMSKMINRVKAAVITAGVSDKEIWDTESAPIGPMISEMSNKGLAERFTNRSLVILACYGISRTFYYQYDHPEMYIKGTGAFETVNQTRNLLLNRLITSVYTHSDGRVICSTKQGLIEI